MRKQVPITAFVLTSILTACVHQEAQWSSIHPVFVNMVKEIKVQCEPEREYFYARPVYYTSLEAAKAHASVRPTVSFNGEHRTPEAAACTIKDLTFQIEIEDSIKNLGKYESKTYRREKPGKYQFLFDRNPYNSGMLIPYVGLTVYKDKEIIGLMSIFKENAHTYMVDFKYFAGVATFEAQEKRIVYIREVDPYAQKGRGLVAVGMISENY